MILSPTLGIIFLHNRKAAGSSVCVSLARLLGPEDLQLSAIVETMEADIPLTDRVLSEARGQAGAALAIARMGGRHRHGRAIARALQKAYTPQLGRKPSHAPAAKIAKAFPEVWAASRKLCVVRNPWDKTVSDYYWRTKAVSSPPDFATYVRALRDGDSLGNIVPLAFHDNWPIYTIDGQIVADQVVRFEALQDGLEAALAALNVPWDGWLPRAKAGIRPERTRQRDYRAHYDDDTAEIVGTLYRDEIAAHGYRF